jgi:hypothetical protein
MSSRAPVRLMDWLLMKKAHPQRFQITCWHPMKKPAWNDPTELRDSFCGTQVYRYSHADAEQWMREHMRKRHPGQPARFGVLRSQDFVVRFDPEEGDAK